MSVETWLAAALFVLGVGALAAAVLLHVRTRRVLTAHGADLPPLKLHQLLEQQDALLLYLNFALNELDKRFIAPVLMREIREILDKYGVHRGRS